MLYNHFTEKFGSLSIVGVNREKKFIEQLVVSCNRRDGGADIGKRP